MFLYFIFIFNNGCHSKEFMHSFKARNNDCRCNYYHKLLVIKSKSVKEAVKEGELHKTFNETLGVNCFLKITNRKLFQDKNI